LIIPVAGIDRRRVFCAAGVPPGITAGRRRPGRARARGLHRDRLRLSRSLFSSRYVLMTVIAPMDLAALLVLGLNMVLIARAMPCDTAPA